MATLFYCKLSTLSGSTTDVIRRPLPNPSELSARQLFIYYNNKLSSFFFHLPFINDFQISPLQKAAHFRFPRQNCGDQFPGDLLFQFIRMRNVPLLQTQFALTAEQQHKLHLQINLIDSVINADVNKKKLTISVFCGVIWSSRQNYNSLFFNDQLVGYIFWNVVK